jgi:hypothetical protein
VRTCQSARASAGGPARWLPALALIGAVTLNGCAKSSGVAPGAHPSSSPIGPTVVATSTIPPLAARVTLSSDPSPARESAIQRLSNTIDEALTRPGRVTPATRVSQKAAAGNQVLVRWTVNLAAPDPGARARVRTDAIKILALVKATKIHYGSVLLLATGASLVKGKKKVSIVVRAKYTRSLVRDTNWAKVSPDAILRMPDDKPAVIAPAYR